MNKLSEIGPRGLVIRDQNDCYYAINQDTWRALPRYPLPSPSDPFAPKIGTLLQLHVALAALSESPPSVFVDLDRLNELPPLDLKRSEPPLQQPQALEPQGRSIWLREGNSFRVIDESTWGDPIPEAATGDARVLIRRGAVLAAIPESEIPRGTFCVLINLRGLLKGSESSAY